MVEFASDADDEDSTIYLDKKSMEDGDDKKRDGEADAEDTPPRRREPVNDAFDRASPTDSSESAHTTRRPTSPSAWRSDAKEDPRDRSATRKVGPRERDDIECDSAAAAPVPSARRVRGGRAG